MKSGNLNFLEPSGPLQACDGIALPFTSNKIGKCKVFEERKAKDLCAPWKASGVVELKLLSFLQQ
jgi:hypothetical protein